MQNIGLVRRGRQAHQPDDTALITNVLGACNSRRCVGNLRIARLVALWSGQVEFTCGQCGNRTILPPGSEALQPDSPFYPAAPAWRDPGLFAPTAREMGREQVTAPDLTEFAHPRHRNK